MKLHMIKTIFNNYRNLIIYAVIGTCCAGLDFCIYSALCYSRLMPYLVANIISINCGIICSFILNRSLNFKVKDKILLRFLSFYAVGLTGLGISEVMLYVMVTKSGWNELICKLVSIIVVALIQFVLNKFITFQKHNP